MMRSQARQKVPSRNPVMAPKPVVLKAKAAQKQSESEVEAAPQKAQKVGLFSYTRTTPCYQARFIIKTSGFDFSGLALEDVVARTKRMLEASGLSYEFLVRDPFCDSDIAGLMLGFMPANPGISRHVAEQAVMSEAGQHIFSLPIPKGSSGDFITRTQRERSADRVLSQTLICQKDGTSRPIKLVLKGQRVDPRNPPSTPAKAVDLSRFTLEIV